MRLPCSRTGRPQANAHQSCARLVGARGRRHDHVSPFPDRDLPATPDHEAPVAGHHRGSSKPLTTKCVTDRALVVGAAGAALYVVLPCLAKVFGAWPRLSSLSPIWLVGAFVAESASFGCAFVLQRLFLRTRVGSPSSAPASRVMRSRTSCRPATPSGVVCSSKC